MFTGLIETLGTVVRVTRRGKAARLAIRSGRSLGRLALGESVAVDGVCLTVEGRRGAVFEATAVGETLARTTLGALEAGDRVHLERALKAGDRLGGHLVQGHVDGVGRVRSLRSSGGGARMAVDVPAPLRRFLAEKGSIALDGVSLTIAKRRPAGVEVALIPETLVRTTLGALRPGDRLNVEIDLIARYLAVLMRDRRR